MSVRPSSRFALLLLACALAAVLVTACGSTASPEAPAASGGGMGMGGAPGESGEGGMITGVVAVSDEATLTLEPGAVSSAGVEIARVVAPADCWVVIRSADSTGAVFGKTHVARGESRGVLVRLDRAVGVRARLAIHIDRGRRGTFEYDPGREGRNFDGPVNVDRTPLELPLLLDAHGVEAPANSVLMLVEDQPVGDTALTVTYLITPGLSWIAVNEFEQGLPGRRIGLTHVGAGELQQIRVPLDAAPRTQQVIVTVHSDLGEAGSFEYQVRDPLGSVDQPFRSAGVIVSALINVE
jgi:hypothetical protein